MFTQWMKTLRGGLHGCGGAGRCCSSLNRLLFGVVAPCPAPPQPHIPPRPTALSRFKRKPPVDNERLDDNEFAVEAMEPRVLLSADALGIDIQTTDTGLLELHNDDPLDPANAADWGTLTALNKGSGKPFDQQSSAGASDYGDESSSDYTLHAADNATTSGPQIVFIDSGVDDPDALLGDLAANAEQQPTQVYLLDADRDGVEQIAGILASHQDIEAIHIISHGAADQIQLGNSTLSSGSLDRYQQSLIEWGEALSASADILIYGCDIAADAAGQSLVDAIGDLTGADVAASADRTGQAAQGGDWELEYQSGAIESATPFSATLQQSWSGVLFSSTSEILVNTPDMGSPQETSAENRGSQQAVAMDDNGNYVVVWSSLNQDGSGWGVYAQRYDPTGAAQGSEFRVNETFADNQRWASVAMDATGDFTVTWTSDNQDGTASSVYARQFDADGTPDVAGEFRVNTENSGAQSNSTIDMDASGDFIIVWQGNGPAGDADGIYFRRFNADGSHVDATDQLANQSDDTAEHDPVVAMQTAGKFVIAWDEGQHIYHQRFDAAGDVLGSETRIDGSLSTSSGLAVDADASGAFTFVYREEALSTGVWTKGYYEDGSNRYGGVGGYVKITGGDAISPSIEMDDTGNFVVVYHKTDAADGDGLGVYAQRYNASASLIDNQFLVNDSTANNQHSASVAMLDLDNYVVAWSGSSTADWEGVYVRQYHHTGVLWLSTNGDENASNGVPGLDTTGWKSGDILQQADPNFSLGEAGTDGTFSVAFDVSNFAADPKINGIHYVSRDVVIGGTNPINLQAGDLLLSPDSNTTFTSNGNTPPADLAVDKSDIIYFRPKVAGDYSSGNFYMLLSDPFQDGAEIHGLTLVETDVWVGDRWLSESDLLLTRNGGAEESDIWLLQTGTLDPTTGSTYPAAQRLIAGGDSGVDIDPKLFGLDILENNISIGGQSYNAGTILVALDGDDNDGIGSTTQVTAKHDIVALTVNQTTLGSGAGNAQVTASLFFDGDDVSDNDVNFDSGSEAIDALTLTTSDSNEAPSATNLSSTSSYTEGAGSVALDDIVISDADSGETLSATLTLNNTASGSLTTGTYGAATSNYVAGTGVWSVSGTLADVNAALAAVAFVPATNNDVDTSITTHIQDAAGTGPADGSITLDVTPQNDAPSATNLSSTSSYTEGAGSVALDDIVISDADSGETLSATLTLNNTASGSLTTGTYGAATSNYVAGTGVWSVSGTLADVNAALAAVAFVPATNNDVDTSITTHIQDAAGTGPADGSITLDVTPQNDAPSATNLSSTSSYTEGAGTVALDDIVISDADSGETLSATLTLNNTASGSLTTGTYGAATSNYVAGTGVWSVSGTLTDVNAALAAVAFVPTTNNDTDTSITTHIQDAAGTGPADGSITLDVTPQNDAPTATNLSSTSSYTEGAGTVALDDIVISDVDSGETLSATLTLNNTASGSLTTGTYGAATSNYVAGTGVWSVSGTLADVNAALAAVAFVPATNNDVDTSITTHIQDAAGTGPADGSITLDVTPQNDAPSATNLTSTSSYTEGAGTVALDDIVISDVDSGETLSATLTLNNTASGSLTTGTYGAATSNYVAGTGVWSVSGTLTDVNAALAAVAFVPATNNDVDTSITTHIQDAAGTGPADGSITLDVTPQNDAPTATNLSSTSSYTEGAGTVALDDIVISDADSGETLSATLTLNNTASGSLTTGTYGAATSNYNAGTGVWSVSGTLADVNAALAAVAFVPASDNDVDTSITTHIQDAAGTGPADGSITLDVTPQNDAPSATNLSSTSSYTEGAGTVALDDIVISDADSGETLSATLTLNNTASGSLTTGTYGAATSNYVAGTGVWSVSGTLADVNAALAAVAFVPATNNDVDTSITTHIQDAAGTGPADGSITLDVTPQNDAPSATNLSSTSSYTEGAGTVALDDIVISDADSGETLSATLTLNNTASGSLTTGTYGAATSNYVAGTGVWSVSGTLADVNAALAAVAFVPATNNDVDTSITTHIQDAAGTGPADGSITLDVTPQNDAPSATNLTSTSSYTEGAGTVALDDIVISDADSGETLSASLTLNNSGQRQPQHRHLSARPPATITPAPGCGASVAPWPMSMRPWRRWRSYRRAITMWIPASPPISRMRPAPARPMAVSPWM